MTLDAWLRGQLLVKGFYETIDSDHLSIFDAHRERTALAVIERENEIEFFTNMLKVAGQVGDSNLRRKIMARLEEVYVLGLREERVAESRREDETLADLAKQVMVVDAHHVGRWEQR